MSLRQLVKRIPGFVRAFTYLRVALLPRYSEDGLLAYRNCAFMSDPDFQQAYDRAISQHAGMAIHWRAHVTQWAGYHAAKLDGDFVECGVNRGFLSRSVMEYIHFETLDDRRFYLFDTFSGLVPEQVTLEDHAAYWNEYEDTYDLVTEAFKGYPNVVIVRGTVPDSLNEVDIQRVAYLSLDMNCAFPEVAALEHFWPKMSRGGIIVLDDYAFVGHENQQRKADDFAQSVGVKVLALPTGQGIVFKP